MKQISVIYCHSTQQSPNKTNGKTIYESTTREMLSQQKKKKKTPTGNLACKPGHQTIHTKALQIVHYRYG